MEIKELDSKAEFIETLTSLKKSQVHIVISETSPKYMLMIEAKPIIRGKKDD